VNRRNFLKSIFILGVTLKSNIASGSLYIKEKIKRVISIDISSESTEGGEIKCFIEGGSLLKVERAQCWESGRTFLSILLSRGNVLVVQEKTERYNVPFYVTAELAKEIGSKEYFDLDKSDVTINNYYFENNCAVHVKSNKSDSECAKDFSGINQFVELELANVKKELKKRNAMT
jgi:hypothetical protein